MSRVVCSALLALLLVAGVQLQVNASGNPYHCVSDGGGMSDAVCDYQVVPFAEYPVCACELLNGEDAPIIWGQRIITDDWGAVSCCWDWNGNGCCHLSDLNWVTEHCEYEEGFGGGGEGEGFGSPAPIAGVRHARTEGGIWETCPPVSFIYGGSTTYPLVPCAGTDPLCTE